MRAHVDLYRSLPESPIHFSEVKTISDFCKSPRNLDSVARRRLGGIFAGGGDFNPLHVW